MKSGLLVSFGCSWTHGVGSAYEKGMTLDEYKLTSHHKETITPNSFRYILAEKFNLENVNFARGGSSNQTQFRGAIEFFGSDQFFEYKKQYDKIVVLWGITSTARNEFYSPKHKRYRSFMYHRDTTEFTELAKCMLEKHYNHDVEVQRLCEQMIFWNNYFELAGIKNIWFDTFNHHDYKESIANLCFEEQSPRDLLSKLSLYKRKDSYHHSDWTIDSDRVHRGMDEGMLNPYSKHPTKIGHKFIANILEPFIEERLA